MNLRNFFFFLAASLLPLSLWAQNASQPILTLIEESTTSRYKDTISPDAPGIVDINSVIRIKLDRGQIEEEMFRLQGISSSDERLVKLQDLNRLMRFETEILRQLNENFRASAQPSLAVYQKWALTIQNLINEIKQTDPSIIEDINANVEEQIQFLQQGGTYGEYALDKIEARADRLRKELQHELGLNESGDSTFLVYFRLGAFIKDRTGGRPIHVENFDNYNREEYQEVARFGASISAAEQQALQENTLLAREMAKQQDTVELNFGKILNDGINSLFSSIQAYSQLRTSYDSVRLALRDTPNATQSIQALDQHFSSINSIRRIYDVAQSTFNNLASGGITAASLIDNEPDIIVGRLEQVVRSANTNYDSLTLGLRPPSETVGNQELQVVFDNYQNLSVAVNKDISGIRSYLGTARTLISQFRKSYLKSEAFSEQVKRFTAGNLPEEGYIELKYIGRRGVGDEILIKATLERGRNTRNANFERRELYRRYLSLQRISTHVKMSGALILANPYLRDNNARIDLESRYQFTPTYGIFLKWGSRKSRFYNDFLDLGIGMGFSSPDFNTDGTPEFGAGVMMTALKDVISVGWGWNFGMDTPYTFIGFNIPFSLGGFPSANASGGFGVGNP